MTRENRADKIKRLAGVCDWVNGQWIDDYGYAILRWPAPKSSQLAEVDIRSGVIRRFVVQSGAIAEEVSADGYERLIDRRIYYLTQTHKHLWETS